MLQDQKADAQLVGTDLESDIFFAKNKQTNKKGVVPFKKKKKTLLQQEFSFQNAVILSIKYYFGHAAKKSSNYYTTLAFLHHF